MTKKTAFRWLLPLLILGGFISSFSQKRPLVVFVCGDHEYSGEITMPYIAKELEKNFGFSTKVLTAFPNQNAEKDIPGLEILEKADLVVFFLRWRQLPENQLAHIEKYLRAGKPVMGFRTSTHAFNFPENHPSAKWNAFGEWAFNAPPGWGGKAGHTHYGHHSTTQVSVVPISKNHPVLKGLSGDFQTKSWLYHVLPSYPSLGSEWLLMGKAVNPDKPAIDNPVAWTGKNSFGGTFFFSTLGHPEDFQLQATQQLTLNAIQWCLGIKNPKKLKKKISMNVPYRGIVK